MAGPFFIRKQGTMTMKNTGANMESVRKKNRAAILKYINDHGLASRKDLADILGLTPAAVTQICTDLFDDGILVETGENVESARAGRKKVLLDINYSNSYVCGINIDPETTTVAIADYKGTLLAQKSCRTDTSVAAPDYIRMLSGVAKKLLQEEACKKGVLAAIGVGVVGLVDKETGSSVKAYGIWKERVPIAAILAESFSVPVYVENNVNAFAVAELLYGAGREHDNLMVVKWGPGVGCAMIIEQDIYDGRHSKAAELGHFIVEKDGALCSCGRHGCLETKVSYTALNKIAPFAEDAFGQVLLDADGTAAGAKFGEALDLFARSLVNSATIMAPNRIVLTGPLFESPFTRKTIIDACMAYDDGFNEERIIYSTLAQKAYYIGPIAICAKMQLFS